MKDGLYNKATGLPKNISFRPILGLEFSYHAAEKARQLNIDLPHRKAFLPAHADVIEVEVIGGKVGKILAREKHDSINDICYVFLTDTKLIKTVWLNRADDTHKTLNRQVFSKPE